MKQDPIKKFKIWWDKAKENSSLHQKNAACLSTINRDGFPSGRFVDLKSIDDGFFIFCTSLESEKAREISKNPKVALTIWWDHVGFQVRITGTSNITSDTEADMHWQNRSRQAQIVSICSEQSEKMNGAEELSDKIDDFKKNLTPGSVVSKPENWGCFKVRPVEIEFLVFNEDRLHIRESYCLKDGEWEKSLLQP